MDLKSFSLEGKVALVTGGSRGMGRAIAITFAHAGADVAVCSRHLAESEKVAQEIRDLGKRSLTIQADTSAKNDVDHMVEGAVRELGRLDILVNNAGVPLRKFLLETSEEEWNHIMQVNLTGYFLCAKAAAQVMIAKKRGVIINITSGAARRGNPRTGAYSVSKAGVAIMTECLAQELAPHNIRVNAIGPGPVRTQFNTELWQDPRTRAEYESRLTIFKRFAEADEVSGIALLLASEASSYVSGQSFYFSNS